MTEAEILAAVRDIMLDVFDLDELTVTPATTAKDVEDWDSLSHIRLVVAIEGRFGLRFSTAEVESFKNVGDMVRSIQSKL